MKNLFFVPFAFDEGKNTSVNVKKNALETYLKNICVSLISAKKTNTGIDVALVTNVKIPNEYEKLLYENDVLIYIEPFDYFVFPDNYLWCLAFYKICALEKMITKYDYDNFIYTDADVFVQKSLNKVYLELKDNILLYDINHGLYVKNYENIVGEFNRFGINSYITHYGGEFFGACRENALLFIDECKKIFEDMRKREFVTINGDEFILSIAAYRMKGIIKNAGAYIYRFWTDSFYLVSTCYKYNAVPILHLPGEKQNGMLKIYDIILKTKSLPPKEKVYRICHLKRQPLISKLKYVAKKFLNK